MGNIKRNIKVAGAAATLAPFVALAGTMDHDDMEMTSSAGTMATSTSSLDGMGIIMTLGLFFLVGALFFMNKAVKTYGGIIGKGLMFVAIGVFGIAINELDSTLHMHFNLDIVATIFNNSGAEMWFHHLLNLMIYVSFAYGFYTLSNILKAVSAPKALFETAPKAEAKAKK